MIHFKIIIEKQTIITLDRLLLSIINVFNYLLTASRYVVNYNMNAKHKIFNIYIVLVQ